jgi:ferredoxin-NADP reductase
MQDDIHYIFTADTVGIASAFPALKKKLTAAENHHVTLLYFSDGNQFIFRKELEILQAHYPARLFVCYYSNAQDSPSAIRQGEIEAIVNANTMQQMTFIISGNAEFTTKMNELLIFLGLKDIQIHKQYFSE